MGMTLAELAKRLDARVRGDAARVINGVAALDQAGPQDLVYVTDKKYLKQLAETRAGAAVLTEADAAQYPGSALIVANPHLAFARAAEMLYPPATVTPGVHPLATVSERAHVAESASVGPQAVIEPGAVIGAGAVIGPGCHVAAEARIGERTRLMAHVVIGPVCVVGCDCLIAPGVVIGADGFGYAQDGARWIKVPQLGRVVIGDAVEIGANSTVDRGALHDTVIGNGVKIDNLVQIAHNVRIGENTVIAGCVGIAGSAVIGKRCAIGGQAGVLGHLEIADDVQITAGSLVTNSIHQAGMYSSSLKAEAVEKWRRNAARLHHLDEMAQRLKQLEEKIDRLSKEPSP
jgi:UDP-3-O-[3-hydroxymyristoyl] glucosamine N-acyltransferase